MAREVAVLIGTGSIGVAIGRRAAIGRNLLLADYNQTALQAMAEQLRGEGYEVTTQATDVSDHPSVAALADAAATLGPVTRVIHAAGVSPVQASTERVLHVDLLGTAYVLGSSAGSSPPAARASWWPAWPVTWAPATPARSKTRWPTPRPPTCSPWTSWPPRRSGTPGRPTPWPSGPTPCACAQPRSPGVNAVPGSTASAPASSPPRWPGTRCRPERRRLPAHDRHLRRRPDGHPDRVAAAAALLLGPDGSFITGSDLLIDGGVIAAMRAAEHAAAGVGMTAERTRCWSWG